MNITSRLESEVLNTKLALKNMNNLSLILLIGENILLILALTIYLTRRCKSCSKVKCIERIFSKFCKACPKTKKTKSAWERAQCEVF